MPQRTTASKQSPVSRDSYFLDSHTCFLHWIEVNGNDVCPKQCRTKYVFFNCVAWLSHDTCTLYMWYKLSLFFEGGLAPEFVDCIVFHHRHGSHNTNTQNKSKRIFGWSHFDAIHILHFILFSVFIHARSSSLPHLKSLLLLHSQSWMWTSALM